MKIDVLTLFPEMFSPLKESIIGRALGKGTVEINIHNIRDYSLDKHKKCDDAPFGGGAGMVMTPQPIADAIESIDPHRQAVRIYLSPKGQTFSQEMVKPLASEGRLLFLCGHYEGIDERIIDLYIDREISIGDYVLTGGELPAMVVIDAVLRYVDGVINGESLKDETFTRNLLEYPQYTRPQVFKGLAVPEVLTSGDHGKVDKWRYEKSLELTKKLRPDLLDKSDKD